MAAIRFLGVKCLQAAVAGAWCGGGQKVLERWGPSHVPASANHHRPGTSPLVPSTVRFRYLLSTPTYNLYHQALCQVTRPGRRPKKLTTAKPLPTLLSKQPLFVFPALHRARDASSLSWSVYIPETCSSSPFFLPPSRVLSLPPHWPTRPTSLCICLEV